MPNFSDGFPRHSMSYSLHHSPQLTPTRCIYARKSTQSPLGYNQMSMPEYTKQVLLPRRRGTRKTSFLSLEPWTNSRRLLQRMAAHLCSVGIWLSWISGCTRHWSVLTRCMCSISSVTWALSDMIIQFWITGWRACIGMLKLRGTRQISCISKKMYVYIPLR